MSLQIFVNNKNFENFLSARVEIALTRLTRIFDFEAAQTEGLPLPFKVQDAVEIKIDGETILTGFIEVIDVSYSSENHQITVSGRDRLGDFVDSTLEFKDKLPGSLLKTIIEEVLKQINLTNITVIDQTDPPLEPFKEGVDLLSASIGEGAWEFIESLARKQTVLVRSTPQGNIVLDHSPIGNTGGLSAGLNPTMIVNRFPPNNETNNVLSSTSSFDSSQAFGEYVIYSQDNTVAAKDVIQSAQETTNKTATRPIPDQRNSRRFVFQSENASSVEDLQKRLDWEINFKQAGQRIYSATLDGFRDFESNLWDVNQIISINDEFASINANMLIEAVVFTFDLSVGQETTLNLVQRDSYIPTPQATVAAKETQDDAGEAFF